MKKLLMALVLSLLVFGKVFACESIFDKIDGITCEIQYILCKGSDIDIKVCDKVLEKVEQHEEAFDEYNNALNSFLGEENLKLVESEEFQNEVWNVLGDNGYLDYNYLMK